MLINPRYNTRAVCCKVLKVTLNFCSCGLCCCLCLWWESNCGCTSELRPSSPLRTVLLFQTQAIWPGIVATGLTEAAASEKHGAEDFPGHAKDNEHHISSKGAGSRPEPVYAMEKCFSRCLRVETGMADNVAVPVYRLNYAVLFVSIFFPHPVFSHRIEPDGFRPSRVLRNAVLPVPYTTSCSLL